jgi:hypothetical protein
MGELHAVAAAGGDVRRPRVARAASARDPAALALRAAQGCDQSFDVLAHSSSSFEGKERLDAALIRRGRELSR